MSPAECEPIEVSMKRTFPNVILKDGALKKTRDLFRAAKLQGTPLLVVLMESLSLRRKDDKPYSFVFNRTLLAKIAGLNRTTIADLIKDHDKYVYNVTMQKVPAALYLALFWAYNYLTILFESIPETEELWLGDLPMSKFVEERAKLHAINNELQGDRPGLPFEPITMFTLGMFPAMLIRSRYEGWTYGAFGPPKLESDGLFSLPAEHSALHWDRYNGFGEPLFIVLKHGRFEASDWHEVEILDAKNVPLGKAKGRLEPSYGLAAHIFNNINMPDYQDHISVTYKVNGRALSTKRIPVVMRFTDLDKALEREMALMTID